MEKIVAKHADIVAVVAAEAVNSAVPDVAFCVLHETVDTEHGKPLDAADGLQRGDGLGVDGDEGGKEGQEREEACHDFSSSLLSEG
jgi:hypothetical protein